MEATYPRTSSRLSTQLRGMSPPDGGCQCSAVHAITVARTHLQRPAQAGGRSGPMPNKPSDHRALQRAVLSVVLAAVVLAACGVLAMGAFRLVHRLF
jgi:hypothetical protein